MTRDAITFKSPFFRLERVADGIYLALATDPVWALGNAGIVDLGDQTLVFDTFLSPRAAGDLRIAAEEQTHHPVTWVVNSHWHDDHFFGNQVFCSTANIISSTKTREKIEQNRALFEANRRSLPDQIRMMQKQIEDEIDSSKKGALRAELARLEQNHQLYSGLDWTVPQLTFDSEFIIHGSRGEAMLISYGGGHTKESDVLLWLPGDSVIFAGDLVVNQVHPWIGHGDSNTWTNTLDQMKLLGAHTVVPGHGPVGTARTIDEVQQYLLEVEKLVERSRQEGKTKSDMEMLTIPIAYQGWADDFIFRGNVLALWDKLSASQ